MWLCTCVCLCVCMRVAHISLGQEDFTLHVPSSVQKPKIASATPTSATLDLSISSGCAEFYDTAQEGELIFIYMESDGYKYLL